MESYDPDLRRWQLAGCWAPPGSHDVFAIAADLLIQDAFEMLLGVVPGVELVVVSHRLYDPLLKLYPADAA